MDLALKIFVVVCIVIFIPHYIAFVRIHLRMWREYRQRYKGLGPGDRVVILEDDDPQPAPCPTCGADMLEIETLPPIVAVGRDPRNVTFYCSAKCVPEAKRHLIRQADY